MINPVSVEMIDKNIERFHKAEKLIWNIQQQADLFEMRTGIEPTIFMSYDLFALLVASLQDVVLHRIDKNQTAHTVCGYDCALIHQGSNLLYVGYKVDGGI